MVSVWDVDTGEKVIQFSRCHGEYEITAMAFDRCGRRLVTGGKDGSIKLWNFNNGECLRVLKNIYNAEVLLAIMSMVNQGADPGIDERESTVCLGACSQVFFVL